MTRIIERLDDIAPAYDVLYCDLWGCLHDGLRPFPSAVAALRRFRARGGRVVLMTNSPRPSPGVIRQLDRMDLPRDAWDLVVSSGDAAQAAMLAGVVGRRVWHLGPETDARFFTEMAADIAKDGTVERVGFEAAEGIVCTGLLRDDETPQEYRGRLLSAKARGLKLLCANPDIIVDQGDTRLYCAGALAALYDEMGGESLYFGKPHPPIYDLARRRMAQAGIDARPDRILVLGDGIGTDVAGAVQEDHDVLFITGGLAADETGTTAHPDRAMLKAFLARQDHTPTFAIGHLR